MKILILPALLASTLFSGCSHGEKDPEIQKAINYLEAIHLSEISTDHIDALKISLGEIEIGNGIATLNSVNIQVENTGETPLWLQGNSLEMPDYLIEYFDTPSDSWVDITTATCGTGTSNHPLKPKQATFFRINLNSEALERSHRIALILSTSPTANNSVLRWSPALDFSIPENTSKKKSISDTSTKKSSTAFAANCSRLSDFDLCNRVALAIEDLYPNLDYNQIDAQNWRTVLEIWGFQGFTEKEGLIAASSMFYFNDYSASNLAGSYEIIGLENQGDVLWKINEVLEKAKEIDRTSTNDSYAFQNLGELESFFRSHVELDDLEREMWDAKHEVVEQLAEFIRSRLQDFSALKLKFSVDKDHANIGWLRSFGSWLTDYASENDDQIPTMAELKSHAMHGGIKQSSVHKILVTGNLSNVKDDEPIVRYLRSVHGKQYVITKGMQILPAMDSNR